MRQDEWPSLGREIREHEPRDALVSGPSGLEVITELITAAPEALAPGGKLFLEMGESQRGAVEALLARGSFRDVRFHKDLAGHDRVAEAALVGAQAQ